MVLLLKEKLILIIFIHTKKYPIQYLYLYHYISLENYHSFPLQTV